MHHTQYNIIKAQEFKLPDMRIDPINASRLSLAYIETRIDQFRRDAQKTTEYKTEEIGADYL